jgi:uncharacterized protein DUF3515
VRTRPSALVLVAVALPLLLAVAVAAIAVTARVRGVDGTAASSAQAASDTASDTAPLAVVPVAAPDAGGAQCTALLAALPSTLPADGGSLPPRTLADPAPPGTRAWAALPRPVVLRCGLTRPAELTPSSPLLDVNGVSWLRLDDGVPDPAMLTWVAVDRPVYVVVTAPTEAGSGPLQAVADAVRATLPPTEVAVR